MHINDLKIFIAIADYGTFTQAAIATNTVQSNVSARIKVLEDYFGDKLLKRSTRSAELTPAGTSFLKLAREILGKLEDFKESLADSTVIKGQLKIGCLQTTAALRAPAILQQFTESYPEVEFKLKTGTTASLIKEVLTYKLDGAFVSGELNNGELEGQTIVYEELGVVYAKNFGSLDDLIKANKTIKLIVFSKGCTYRHILTELLATYPEKTIRFIEMDSLEAIIQAVEQGLGITLLPTALIEKQYAFRNVKTESPADKLEKVPTVFIKRKDFPMNNAYKEFFSTIQKGYPK